MGYEIKKVAVIGAGVMGAGIAAHYANCGLKVLLLDILPGQLSTEDEAKGLTRESPEWRNRLSIRAIEGLKNARHPAFKSEESLRRITFGNLEDDFDLLADCDWILETIVEKLDIKRPLFARIDKLRKPNSIITTNTSGLPIRYICEGRSEDFKKHFLGTHFFNPPTFVKLLEVIPHGETDPEVLNFMLKFCRDQLDKNVLLCKDTPNFIANRIGGFTSTSAMHLALKMGMRVEEVDALCGRAMARLRTAVFLSADAIGLDTSANVTRNIYPNIPDDESREVFKVPAFMEKMIENGWLGEKTGQGFYKTVMEGDKKREMVIDLETVTYRDRIEPDFPCLKAALAQDNPADMLKTLIADENDRGSVFAWEVLANDLIYSANRVGEICDTLVDIDNAMDWGYFWRLTPFKAWDAIGVRASVERMKREGKAVPAKVEKMLAKGYESFYAEVNGVKCYYDFRSEQYQPLPA